MLSGLLGLALAIFLGPVIGSWGWKFGRWAYKRDLRFWSEEYRA
jgi:hypothetical protein